MIIRVEQISSNFRKSKKFASAGTRKVGSLTKPPNQSVKKSEIKNPKEVLAPEPINLGFTEVALCTKYWRPERDFRS